MILWYVGDLELDPHLLIELHTLVCGAWTAAVGGRVAGPRRVLAARALCVRSRRSGHLRRVRVGTVWVYDIHWGAGGVLACWEVD